MGELEGSQPSGIFNGDGGGQSVWRLAQDELACSGGLLS